MTKYIITVNDEPDSILNNKKVYKCEETGTYFTEEQLAKMYKFVVPPELMGYGYTFDHKNNKEDAFISLILGRRDF